MSTAPDPELVAESSGAAAREGTPPRPGRASELVHIDRDLSWLEFNRRVLAEACDDGTQLLERAKFLAIVSANLDEFFMKRMALLRERQGAGAQRLRAGLRTRILELTAQQAECFSVLLPELSRHGVHLRDWSALTSDQQLEASTLFEAQISPALTPLVIHPAQPFPFFSNLSLSLTFRLRDERTGDEFDARVKVPKELPQWVRVSAGVPPDEYVFVRLHEVIRQNAHSLYPGMRLGTATLFRVTRDAEVELDSDDDEDIQEVVKAQIRQRRFEPVVRLQLAWDDTPRMAQLLSERFELTDEDVYTGPGELDYTSLSEIASLNIPALCHPAWEPRVPPRLEAGEDVFAAIRAGDLLVHHPYESFEHSVERFIDTAADDPHTLAIKMTVYRVGDDTPFVRSLIRAAEAGKQVACVIELKARFDEERNLHWATELGRAGAHVNVGDLRLKTHAKLALVVRKEDGAIRCYAHVGTGNYHVKTARLYTDVSLLTCDAAVTADVVAIFHHLTGRSEQPRLPTLLVAPGTMRQGFLTRITREIEHHVAGRPARIVAQMNQLEDAEIIDALCAASTAGVPIDLIVRGFCCLRPGVAGITDHIRVRSIVGRFLEHARIYHFANGHAEPVDGEFLISSADWMVRNLSRRVETATPVRDRTARERLWEVLSAGMRDVRQSWEMKSDGSYARVTADRHDDTPGVQAYLMELACRRSGDI